MQPPDLAPRKRPRQARAIATVDALVEGCARVLREGGVESATSNRIAETAGVAIGSLYEYFPNRDAIVYALTLRRLESLRDLIADALAAEPPTGSGHLLRHVADAVWRDAELFRFLLRDAPHLMREGEVRRVVAQTAALLASGVERSGELIDLPDPPADVWLLTRMLAHAVLEIAFEGGRRGAPSRERLVTELVRLTQRMLSIESE